MRYLSRLCLCVAVCMHRDHLNKVNILQDTRKRHLVIDSILAPQTAMTLIITVGDDRRH